MAEKSALVTYVPSGSGLLNAFGASAKERAYPLHVRRRFQRTRSIISRFLLVINLAALALTLADVHGPARLVFGLVLGLVIPGWSIVGLLRLDNGPLEASLTVAMSLVVLTLAAQLMMTIHYWHLQALEVAICVICAVSLAWQSRTVDSATKQRA